MKKTFWLINQYSSTPDIGFGGRQYYIAEELAKQGHQVYVITSSFNHLQRVRPQFENDFYIQNISPNFNFIWIKTPIYKEAHSKKRTLNWFIFSWKLRNLINEDLEKPDVILYSSPAPFGFFGAKYLSKHFRVPLVFEVRDIWPLTLVEIGGISKKHPFIKFMQWVEDKAYQDSDYVFSNLVNAVEHMKSRGMESSKFHWIPSGVSIPEVRNSEPLNLDVISQIPKDKFIVGYTGTIGYVNAMHFLIEAARLLKDYEEIHFVLVGKGKEKGSIIKLAESYDLKNITFINAIPKQQVQTMLQYFDICFSGGQPKPIYRFGVAPNKIPEYLYSAKPIVRAYTGTGCLIKESGAGLSIPSGVPSEISKAILKIYNLSPKERNAMGVKGREYALEHLDYSKISHKIVEILFN